MTTKKQRREQVAAKTAAEREALRQENLAALRRAQDKREQAQWEKEREENKRKAAKKIKEIAEAKKAEVVPDNLKAAHEVLAEGIDVTRVSA